MQKYNKFYLLDWRLRGREEYPTVREYYVGQARRYISGDGFTQHMYELMRAVRPR